MAPKISFSNIASTTAAFQLAGGWYGVAVIGTGFGTVTLQILGPDGTTYLTATTAFSANGYTLLQLPPGSYKFAITTTTAVYASVTAVSLYNA